MSLKETTINKEEIWIEYRNGIFNIFSDSNASWHCSCLTLSELQELRTEINKAIIKSRENEYAT